MPAKKKPAASRRRSGAKKVVPKKAATRKKAARVEAARCLFCFDAPCTRACPTRIDVPKFIRQIMHSDAVGSAETILDANIFGGSCSRMIR